MIIRITKRQLTDDEIIMLSEEVKKFFSPIVGYKDKWKQFTIVYIATINNKLVGVCGIEENKNWLMLHPFVVLEKHHGKGVGSEIMKRVIDDNVLKNIFIGSQNPAVSKIVMKLGFKKVNSLTLPIIVKLYLLRFTLESVNIDFMQAFLKKRSMPHGKFYCFIKENS